MNGVIEKCLTDAFIELCCEKPVQKITVQDIAQAAGVSKQTFYNYFHDKQDLMNSVYYAEINRSFIRFNNMPFGLTELIDATADTLDKLLERKDYYTNIAFYNTQNSFKDCYIQSTHDYYELTACKALGVSKLDAHTDRMIMFNCTGSSYILFDWIKRGMPESPHSVAQEIFGCLSQELKDLIERAKNT